VAAEFDKIQHVFVMAPVAGVAQFDPAEAIEVKGGINHAMLLAGDWDLIGKTKEVHKMGAALNKEKKQSSLNVDIQRGLHTGFEDKLVLFSIPLGAPITAVAYFILSIWEVILVNLFKFFRTRTGQLEASQELMSYFFTQMANKKGVSKEEAENALSNMKEKWQDKVSIVSA